MDRPERFSDLDLNLYVAGRPFESERRLEVFDPYSGGRVGSVPMLSAEDVDGVLEAHGRSGPAPSRAVRAEILTRTADLLSERREEFARLIASEAGLCLRDARYEVGRAGDVFRMAAAETLCETETGIPGTAGTGERLIVTRREPVSLALAITPFNHPLNQVAHKVAPAIAAGATMIVKPSDKTPLTAVRLVELLYEAGLPGEMLSVVLGDVETVVEPMVRDERVEVVSFTGSVAIGKHIARTAGYKRLCLELGGNSPLIVLDDADLTLAVELAAEGSFRNSGQRCTAVKRILVERGILDRFTDALVERTAQYVCGDPFADETRVGTVIDEEAAILLERRMETCVAAGAHILAGGERNGALLQPTVLADVPRSAELIVEESFGPLAPILAVDDLEDAIELANASRFGLSSGVVTRDLDAAMQVVRRLRTGTVNVNQVPGWRTETSPFGGIKDSGLGVKEGVPQAIELYSYVKTFSLPTPGA